MTKKQVAKKLNKILIVHRKQMEKEANEILKSANMWYGDCDIDIVRARNPEYDNDRNGDQFVHDGFLCIEDYKEWLWTKKEVDKAEY